MAVTATTYATFIEGLGAGQFNLTTDTLKVMLTTSAYNPNQDTHKFVTDVTNEVSSSGTGYTTGGNTLAGVTWTYDAPNKRMVLGADAVVFTGVTLTTRYGVIYKSTGDPTTSRLIGYINFGVDKSPVAEDFQITSPSGILRIRAV